MNTETLKYTEQHEWIGENSGVYVVGITDYAQDALGDVTFIELPEVGKEVAQNEETATVESVKAASDIYAPAAGKVVAVNEALESEPEIVNKDPYGEGWFFKLEGVDTGQLEGLMDEGAYKKFVEGLQ